MSRFDNIKAMIAEAMDQIRTQSPDAKTPSHLALEICALFPQQHSIHPDECPSCGLAWTEHRPGYGAYRCKNKAPKEQIELAARLQKAAYDVDTGRARIGAEHADLLREASRYVSERAEYNQ